MISPMVSSYFFNFYVIYFLFVFYFLTWPPVSIALRFSASAFEWCCVCSHFRGLQGRRRGRLRLAYLQEPVC